MTITKEGTLASFYTVNKAPIKHLKVYFSPKQAGEGDPSPSNVREIEGLNGVEVKHTSLSIGDFEVADGPTYIYEMPKELLNTDLIFSIYIDNTKGTNKAQIGAVFFDENNQSLIRRSTIAGINAGESGRHTMMIADIPQKTHYIYFLIVNSNEAIGSNPLIEIKKPNGIWDYQEYEPYRGQTYSATFPALGKNLLNDANRLTLYNQQIIYGRDSFSTASPNGSIYLSAGTYTFSSNKLMQMFAVTNYQSSIIGGIQQNITSYTFTLEEDGPIAISILVDSIDEFTCQLEAGSTATTYEPFNNTIYGGYVDLVTGELVQTFGSFTVNDNTYINTSTTRPTNWLRINLDTSSNNHAPKILPYTSVTDRGELCNKLEASFQTPQPQDRLITQFGAYENKVFYNSIYIHNLGVSYPSLTTAEQCVNYIKELKPTFVYPIATPITYQLTPQQLQTFIGQNNIWSNADRVEVEYDLAESNDELYRRRNQILKASPHLVSVASGNTVDSEAIAHFITNDTLPLKSCIVNIEARQKGSGEPSPSNIREIVGQNNIELVQRGRNLFENNIIGTGTVSRTTHIGNAETRQIILSTTPGASHIGINCFFDESINLYQQNPKKRVTPPGNYYITIGNDQATYQLRSSWYDGDIYSVDNPTNTNGETGNYYIYIKSGNITIPDDHDYNSFLIYVPKITETITETISPALYLASETDRSYEPYKGQTITVQLPNTIYGGQLNLLTGQLIVKYGYVDLGTLQWTDRGYGASQNRFAAMISDGKVPSPSAQGTGIGYCDKYHVVQKAYAQLLDGELNVNSWNIGSQYYAVVAKKTDCTTVEQITNAMQGAHLVYELQTPQTYQLTPQQIRTLRGVNNIWSNAGPVSLQYWTH